MARKKVYNEDAARDFDLSANPQPLTTATPAKPQQATPQPAQAEQAPQAEPEKTGDLGAMIAELTRLDNTPVANWPRAKQYEHRRKRDELAKRIHVMQQMPPAPVIDANDMAREQLAQAQVAVKRETLIAKLKKIARR